MIYNFFLFFFFVEFQVFKNVGTFYANYNFTSFYETVNQFYFGLNICDKIMIIFIKAMSVIAVQSYFKKK
jgi:hypothetical protein